VSVDKEHVMTVSGPVSPKDLGITLTHEHCLIDLRSYWNSPQEATRRAFAEAPVALGNIGRSRRNPFLNRDNLILSDAEVAAQELMEFRKLGGQTVVDLTLPDIGRDPTALLGLAKVTGLNIVAGCGHYIQISHPQSIAAESIESISERLLMEIREGIGDTRIQAGVLGEIGTSCPIHPDEEKVLRAAARAHKATGIAIAVHLSPAPTLDQWMGPAALDILEREGVDPRRVLLCHLDNMLAPGEDFRKALKLHSDLAERGCFLGYDGCGKEHYFPSGSRAAFPSFWCPHDRERAVAATSLLESGFGAQLLLSHDICFKIELTQYGGFGYGHVLRTFACNLQDYGIREHEIEKLLTDNPRRWLTPGCWSADRICAS
jgi:phosphotriesterase-related protein